MPLPFRSYPNFRAFPLGVIVLSFMGRIVVASGRLDAGAQSAGRRDNTVPSAT